MTKIRYSATGLMLTIALTFGAMPRPVSAGDKMSEGRAARLDGVSSLGPIGKLLASRAAIVNGRSIQGEHVLWGGELVQTPATVSVAITLDSIGQVTLVGGSLARFSTAALGREDTGRHLLVGSLTDGGVNVKLNNDARAYIEAAGSGFTASPGSSFSLAIRDGRAALTTISGNVAVSDQAPAQRRYILRPVGFGSTISVRARTTRQVQIQVTDENDKPVPDLPIIFALAGVGGKFGGALGSGASAGSSASVTTNALGRATVNFTAGDSAGSDSLTATVKDTNNSLRIGISVTAATGFWSARNTLIIVAIAAAAGAAIGFAVTRDGEQLRQVPPPKVKP